MIHTTFELEHIVGTSSYFAFLGRRIVGKLHVLADLAYITDLL